MGIYSNFYIIFYCVSILTVIEIFFLSQKNGRISGFFTMVFLIILIGFRGEFDSDYAAYVGIYDGVKFDNTNSFLSSFELNVEPLFVITIIFLKIFTLGSQSIFFVCALISLSVNWNYCLRWMAYPSLVLLGLLSHSFLYREFTEIRHGIAGAICVASFFLLTNSQTRKAFMLQLIALFFHSATLFIIAFSIIFCITTRKKFIFICTCIGAELFILGIHNLFEIVGNFFTLPSGITVYLQSEYDYNLGLLNPNLIKQVILLILFLIFSKYLEIKEKRYADFLCLYYVSIIWLFGANEFAMFAGRLASFFGVIDAYLFSMTLFYIRGNILKMFYVLFVIAIYFSQFYLNLEYKNIFLGDYIFF